MLDTMHSPLIRVSPIEEIPVPNRKYYSVLREDLNIAWKLKPTLEYKMHLRFFHKWNNTPASPIVPSETLIAEPELLPREWKHNWLAERSDALPWKF